MKWNGTTVIKNNPFHGKWKAFSFSYNQCSNDKNFREGISNDFNVEILQYSKNNIATINTMTSHKTE